MNKLIAWGSFAMLIGSLLFVGIIWNAASKIPHGFYEPHVRVIVAGGHGSGTHIGNGYILTAGHVASGVKKVTIETNQGNILPADVLWYNKEMDVALLKLERPSKMSSVTLDCVGVHIGDRVTAYGNPKYLKGVYTAGEVVGNPVKLGSPTVMTIDMTAAPGMSGGGIIGPNGTLVGILVGGMGDGFAFTFAVPSRVVCDLMGRA